MMWQHRCTHLQSVQNWLACFSSSFFFGFAFLERNGKRYFGQTSLIYRCVDSHIIFILFYLVVFFLLPTP